MGNWPTPPPAGNAVVYLQYIVYSRTPEMTEDLRTAYGGYGVLGSPARLRDEIGINEGAIGFDVDDEDYAINFPYPPTVVERQLGTGIWQPPIPVQGTVVYPSNGSGDPYWWPPLSVVYDYNEDYFIVSAHPSVPIWGAGRDTTYLWSAVFCTMSGNDTSDEDGVINQPIVVRRGISGAEMGRGGDTGQFSFGSPEGDTGSAELYSRDASRTIDGVGWALRSNTEVIRKDFSGLTNGYKGWNQIYGRTRYLPTAAARFYQIQMSGANSAMSFNVDTDGSIEVIATDQTGATVNLGNTAPNTLPLGIWKRVDFIWKNIASGVGPTTVHCTVDIYVNKVNVGQFIGVVNTNSGGPTLTLERVQLGDDAANDLGMDLDDHTVREHPSGGSGDDTIDLNRWDWVLGSHCQLIRPTAKGAGTAVTWLGDFRIAMQNPAIWATEEMTCATSGARLELDTELDGDVYNNRLNLLRQFGAASFVVGLASTRAGASTTAELGYKIGSDPDVLVTQTDQQARLDGYNVLANPSAGEILPQTIEPLQLLYEHALDTVAEELKELQVVVEFLGSWGPEDDSSVDAPGLTDALGIHNGPYLTAYLGNESPPPINSVGVAAFTYVGNGTGQDIVVELPGIHFLWIRNTAVDDFTIWTTSLYGAQYLFDSDDVLPANAVQVMLNADGSTTIRLAGGHVGANQNLVTYQVIAFSDAASRFMLNGAFKDTSAGHTFTSTLFNNAFTPEAGLFIGQAVKNTLGGVQGYIKGPGNAAAQINPISSAQENGMTFGAGSLISTNNLHGTTIAQGFCLMRMDDGSGAGQAIIIGTYIGNGVSPRTIAVDLLGRRPMFAIVKSVTGVGDSAVFRDPSNLLATSTSVGGGSEPDAIRGGGVDQIIVGATLNVNLRVYNVIIIPSCSDTAGNGGWGINETCGLAEVGWEGDTPIPFFPEAPPYIPEPPPEPSDATIVGSGGFVLSGAPATLLIKDMSGIYTLVAGKTDDTIYDRQTGQTSVDVKIPDPTVKIGWAPE